MKSKLKLLTSIALAASLMAVSAVALTACDDKKPDDEGNKPPVTAAHPTEGKTWAELKTLSVADWDAKTISYQYYTTIKLSDSYTFVSEGQGPDAKTSYEYGTDLGANIHVLMNLYSDGSVAMFQADAYDMDGATWWNADYHISTVYYGTWSGGGEGSGAMGQGRALKVYLVSEFAASTEKIQADDKWAEGTDGAYNTEMNGKEGGGSYIFPYTASTRRYLAIYPQCSGTGTNKTEVMLVASEGTFQGQENNVTYNKISDWVATYNNSIPSNKIPQTNITFTIPESDGEAGGPPAAGGPEAGGPQA